MRSEIPSLLFLLAFAASGAPAHAVGGVIPPCIDTGGRPLSINNAVVADWQRNAQNSFRARAHVAGSVTNIYPDRVDVQNFHSKHHHFQLELDSGAHVEVIFNEDFGDTPAIEKGMHVEVCGDYITSIEDNPPYPASPDGAIIHWVHRSPNHRHLDGYIAIEGIAYGLEAPQRQ